MKKYLLIIVINIISNLIVLGQPEGAEISPNDYNVIPPSPNASSLGKYGEIPVSLYTGTPEISIPLFELKSGDVTIPISLSYHASGIKVNDMASWVGLGWSLNAGGVITRSMRGGFEDEHYGWYRTDGNPDRVWRTGYIYRDRGICAGDGFMFGAEDLEPDLFFYNYSGGAGKFVFDSQKRIHLIPYTPNKITVNWENGIDVSYTNCTRDEITGMTITSNQGYVFNFNEYEKTDSYTWDGKFFSDLKSHRNYKSAWYLNEIFDQHGVKRFNFDYRTIAELRYDAVYDYTYIDSDFGQSSCACNAGRYILGPNNNYSKVINAKRIQRIDFDDGYVLFYADHVRQDFIGDNALTRIELYDNNEELIKKYILDYDYFTTGGSTGATGKRLQLKSLTEEGENGNQKPPYTFDYNSTELPERGSQAQDWWGYYNHNVSQLEPQIYIYPAYGKDSYSIFNRPSGYLGNQYIVSGSNRNCNSNDVLAASLERITYPTGGYTEFEFEPHWFYYQGAERMGGGIRIKSQTIHDGREAANDLITNYHYTNPDLSNQSSGGIVTLPVFGYPCNSKYGLDENNYSEMMNFYETTTLKKSISVSNLGATQGSFVGYSDVKVEKTGNGFTTYKYTSPSNTPDISPTIVKTSTDYCNPGQEDIDQNSQFPYSFSTSLEARRGNLLESKVFNSDGSVVKMTENEYDLISKSSFSVDDIQNYWSGPNELYDYVILTSTYNILSEAQVLKKTTVTEYPSPGELIQLITSITEYVYDSNYLNLKEKTELIDGANIKHWYKYAPDFVVGNNIYSNMTDKNMVGIPIEIVQQKNNNTIGAKLTTFTKHYSADETYIVPSEIYSLESDQLVSDNSFFENTVLDPKMRGKVFFTRYQYGKLSEYNTEGNIPVTIVWAYGYNLPVAKIENSTQQNVVNALGNIGHSLSGIEECSSWSTDDTQLRNIFDQLRSEALMSNSMITSYTYDPLKGITSKTEPNGTRTYYIYDDFGRLETVKDQDGVVLKHIEYNYIYNDDPNSNEPLEITEKRDEDSGCYEASLTVTATGGSGNYTYEWTTTDNNAGIANTLGSNCVYYLINDGSLSGSYGAYVTCTVCDQENPDNCITVNHIFQVDCD